MSVGDTPQVNLPERTCCVNVVGHYLKGFVQVGRRKKGGQRAILVSELGHTVIVRFHREMLGRLVIGMGKGNTV